MRHTAMVMLALVLLPWGIAGCARLVPETPQTIDIYATFYPIYALAEGVLRDVPNVELHCLVQPQDGCLRAYQLSDWDSALLESADTVIMGGRGLENFESALLNWNSDTAVSAVLYNLELYNNAASSAASDQESHLEGPNPHLYMSIEGAKTIVESIGASMVTLDPAFANRYADNVQKSTSKLDDMLKTIDSQAENLKDRPVVLMNEALIYVAQDYGLTVADWIDRESGTAFYDQQLTNCLERLSESGARLILIERQAPQSFVDALEQAGYAVARIDIFSTHRQGEGFDDYIDAQLKNAEAICDAFKKAEEAGKP